jgi:hypothetical protein
MIYFHMGVGTGSPQFKFCDEDKSWSQKSSSCTGTTRRKYECPFFGRMTVKIMASIGNAKLWGSEQP